MLARKYGRPSRRSRRQPLCLLKGPAPASCPCFPALAIMRAMETVQIMIVDGEPSGDAHADALVEPSAKAGAGVKFISSGQHGPLLRAAGVERLFAPTIWPSWAWGDAGSPAQVLASFQTA